MFISMELENLMFVEKDLEAFTTVLLELTEGEQRQFFQWFLSDAWKANVQKGLPTVEELLLLKLGIDTMEWLAPSTKVYPLDAGGAVFTVYDPDHLLPNGVLLAFYRDQWHLYTKSFVRAYLKHCSAKAKQRWQEQPFDVA